MWILLLPLVTVSSVTPVAEPAVSAPSPRRAQRQLAEALAAADSIDAVHARDRTVSFAITRAGTAFSVDATTRRSGEVVSLIVSEAPGARVSEHGGLTWLGDELASGRIRVTRLVVDEDGAVTIATSAGRTYMAIPGRGSGGNAAVEARWAAAWDSRAH